MANKPRLLFVVTEDWYFVLHWMNLARAAREAGFDVAVATRVHQCIDQMRCEGLEVFALSYMRRANRRPWVEVRAFCELAALYKKWKPTLIHHIAAKPMIYGGNAARGAKVPAVVHTLAGLGFVFTSNRMQARLLKPPVVRAYRAALKHPNSTLIVQNVEDERLALELRLTSRRSLRRIAGAGVDTGRFQPAVEPSGQTIVLLAARMLADKGIYEFVEAARIAKSRGLSVRFVLVGALDTENPSAIPESRLRSWHTEGIVEYWGHRNDMPSVLKVAHIVCLPSYREGLSTALLEAAACGRPMVASDIPGCREIAIHNETGLLVPPHDAAALASAIELLAGNAELRRQLGRRARELVLSQFTIEHVNRQTLDVYEELLKKCVPA